MTGILQSLLGSVSSAVAVVTDAYFNLVTLLLPGNGTNGAQNNTFLDSSSNNFTITRNGNTTQGTFSPFSQTGWSNFFDAATNTYLSMPSNTAFAWGTGAYTVEGWVYLTARTNNESLFFTSGGSSGGFNAFITQTGAVKIEKYGTGDVVTGNTNDVPLNTWCHVAYVRSSTSANATKIYVNGVEKASGTDSNDWTVSSAPVIGMLTANTDYAIKGYISNFRIVKGTAVYTGAFTPPTSPLTAITNTSLLTCQSNRFVDNSSNAFAITVNGTPSVQAFSPFAPTAAYSASTNGGSGYFDGSGDYLSAASNTAFAFGTGDFTWEAWLYRGASATQEIYTTIATNGFLLYISSNKAVVRQLDVADRITSSADVALNTWTHIAVARSGTTMSLWLNGSRTDGGTATNSNDFAQNGIRIGISANTAFPFTGYISGMRVVKGTAVYDPTQTSITVPTAPPTAVTNTQLLTNFTNAGITDATAKNDLETVGNAQISTTQSKFGGSSMYFDGTGDYLRIPSSAILALGTGAYTIEFWIYPNALAAGSSHVVGANSTNGIIILVSNAKVALNKYGVGDVLAYNTALTTSTWSHVAVVREGTGTNQTKIYVNGTSVATGTDSNDWTVTSLFGLGANLVDGSQALNGYIDDLRITRGYARYTANFTAPTAAFPLS